MLHKTCATKNIFLSGFNNSLFVQLIKRNIFDPVTGFQVFSVTRYSLLFITSIALAHSGLSLQQIGLYETLLLISGMFSFFYTGAITTKLLSADIKDKSKNYKMAFTIILSISALVALLLFSFRNYLNYLLNVGDVSHIKYFALYILFSAPGFLLEYFFLLEKKMKALLAYGIIYGVSYFLIVSVLSFTNARTENIFIALIILAFARFLVLLILIFGNKSETFEWKDISQFCFSAFPILLSLLLSGCADYIDSLLALNYLGPEQLAIFRYGAKELPLSLLLANAMSNAMVPVLSGSNNFSQSVSELKRRASNLMRIVFPVSIALMLTAKWIYPIVFSQRFAESALIFCIYLLLVCSRVTFPQTLLLAKGHFKKIAVASAIELVINLIASILLMHHYGLTGIATGTVIAFMSEKLILLYFVKKDLDIKASALINLKEYLIFSVFLLVSFYYVIFY